MRRLFTIAIVASAVLSGCELKIKAPPGFVEVQGQTYDSYDLRSVSADGVVIGLRTEDNPKDGTLDFWATAVRNELVGHRGYKLVKDEPVESVSGAPGRLLTFSANRSGARFTYMAAVYVIGQKVAVIEAGGKANTVAPKTADIRKAMLSIRPGGI